jgi:hypothetical protein
VKEPVSDLLRDRQAFQPDEARLRKQTNMTSTAFHGLHLTREKYLSSPRRLSVTTYSFFSFLVIDYAAEHVAAIFLRAGPLQPQ